MLEDIRKTVIYEMQNRITKQSYVGATYNGFFSRIGQHVNKLIKGAHCNKRFQSEWNRSDITDWDIRILEYDILQDRTKEREEYWINRRGGINIQLKSSHQLRQEKYFKIACDLHDGLTYRQIAKKRGVALGTVGNVARKFVPQMAKRL